LKPEKENEDEGESYVQYQKHLFSAYQKQQNAD
jgi:hypothetical protein